MGYSLVNEPRVLNEVDLNLCRGAQSLARSSILGYNKILRYKGKLARDGEIPGLGLGITEEVGLAHEPFTALESPLSELFVADLVCPALSCEVSLGLSEFHDENLAPLPFMPVVAENSLSNEPLGVLPDTDSLKFNTMLDCLTVPCMFEEMFEDGSTAQVA